MKKQGTLFIISGTSQVGKSAIIKILKKNKSLQLTNIKTNTTRPPRPEDKKSKQYYFRSINEFKKLIKEKKLLEWAKVHGYYYGTPREEVLKALNKGKNVTLIIDIQGALQVKKIIPQAVTVFITAESIKEIKRRIIQSPYIPEKQKLARWRSALKELKYMKYYDYIIINKWGRLNETAKKVAQIIKNYHKK